MASEVAGGMITHLFPSLGPALMISMGYIDLGKWVAAVEGGARFGFDLVFLVLLFNCTAIVLGPFNLYWHGHWKESCRGIIIHSLSVITNIVYLVYPCAGSLTVSYWSIYF